MADSIMLPMPKLKKGIWLSRVALTGPMASGKTTAADYLVEHKGYTKVSFAAKLKLAAWDLMGVSGKDGESRKYLQWFGQTFREQDSDIWVKHALLKMQSLGDDTRIVLDDCRYKNEEHWLRKNGFVIICVDTPEDIRMDRVQRLYPNTPEDAHTHDSETQYKQIKPDFIIRGTGYDTQVDLEQIFKDI